MKIFVYYILSSLSIRGLFVFWELEGVSSRAKIFPTDPQSIQAKPSPQTTAEPSQSAQDSTTIR